MNFGTEQLVMQLQNAKQERDEAKVLYEERAAVERDNLQQLRRLRADLLADPIEVNNCEIRAAAYEKSVRALWDNWQQHEGIVKRAMMALSKQGELLGALRSNLAHAERNVTQLDVRAQVDALERQIAELQRKHQALVSQRDGLRTQIATLENELLTYAPGMI